MIKNSCCSILIEKCLNDPKDMSKIQTARNALIDFYIGFSSIIASNAKNPDENAKKQAHEEAKKLLIPAQEAVKTINQLCANKKINYIFKGKPADAKAIYNFAKQITTEIIDDMIETQLDLTKEG